MIADVIILCVSLGARRRNPPAQTQILDVSSLYPFKEQRSNSISTAAQCWRRPQLQPDNSVICGTENNGTDFILPGQTLQALVIASSRKLMIISYTGIIITSSHLIVSLISCSSDRTESITTPCGATGEKLRNISTYTLLPVRRVLMS